MKKNGHGFESRLLACDDCVILESESCVCTSFCVLS